MNHQEYLSRLEDLSDGDAASVLAHVEGCRLCRADSRAAGRALRRLGGPEGARSRFEEVTRLLATAAAVAVLVLGIQGGRSEPPAKALDVARYRIVGGPEGVIAYTPAGIVVGIGAPPQEVPR